MKNLDFLFECTGFEWDEANAEKNWLKHKVTPSESEQVFFNQPLVVGMTRSILTRRSDILL